MLLDLYQSQAGLVVLLKDMLEQRGQPEQGGSRGSCMKKLGFIKVPDLAP